MAESTLSLTYTQLQFEVAHYLGLGAVTSWDAEDISTIDLVISSALRQFYFPAPVMEDGRVSQLPHEWSFLKPVASMVTVAPYSTGTIAIANGATTVTLTGGVWPTWTATNGALVVGTTEYVIASRTNDTVIELAESWTETTETASGYVLQHNGIYDLPDDFGGMVGDMVIESSNYEPPIVVVGEGRIRNLRQQNPQTSQSTSSTSTPFFAAVRPKKHDTTTTGQRYEIMFYPLPYSVYTISYKYRVLPEMLVTTTIEYPYGGMEHAETLRAACIAAAEEKENGNRLGGNPVYDKKKLFQERLAASIQLDKMKNGVDYYGYCGDRSDLIHRPCKNEGDVKRGLDNTLVTYNGSTT
jgi:hypothetical protein